MPRKLPLATPGKILLHDFLEPMGIAQYRFAKEIGVPQRRIGEIVAGRRSVTAAPLSLMARRAILARPLCSVAVISALTLAARH